MSRNICTILKAVVESKPDVGSSKNRSDGFSKISLPIHTLFLSPPETPLTNFPPITVFWHLSSPSSHITSHALSFFCCGVKVFGSRRRAVYVRVSFTVRWGNTTSSCITNPILFQQHFCNESTRLQHLKAVSNEDSK